MPEQTAIAVPPAPATGACEWCGEPATERVPLDDKPRYRNDRGVRVVARAARTAWACPNHLRALSAPPPAAPTPTYEQAALSLE